MPQEVPSPKVSVMRATDVSGLLPQLEVVRQTIVRGFEKNLGAQLTEDETVQVFLPPSEGGFGLRDPVVLWSPS